MRKTRFLLHGIIFGALLMVVVLLLVPSKNFAHTGIEHASVAASAVVDNGKTESAEEPYLAGTSTPYVFDGDATGFSSSEIRLLSGQESAATAEVENKDATAPREGTDSANAVWITVSILFITLSILAGGGMVYFMLLHRKTLEEMQVAEAEYQSRIQEMRDTNPGRVKDELRQEFYKTNIAIENLANQVSRSDRQLIEYLKKEIDWLGERIDNLSVLRQDESPAPQGEDKDKSAALKGQVKELSETNARLKEQVNELLEENEELKKPRFVGRPIEDYLPAIKEALDYADSCEYDEHNPQGSFASQRQQLKVIEKLINRYCSQR